MSVPDKLKGRYEIREVLGKGGMGLVFRAWDSVIKREVSLKTLRDAPTRAALQMFYKECEVLASLSHPNIVEIFDIGEYEEDGKSKPFFVMPLLAGATLDQLIKTASHRLTVERVVDMLCQACRGLQAAHERGLIHRDMKPSNLFILDDDSVKIIDFGVAHMVQMDQSVGIKGTLVYMPPEQLQMKPATPASDIYSLAVVAYEALTRRRPFEGSKETEIAEAILQQMAPPLSEINPAVSQALSRVIHKGLAKQPWNRYASAKEFAETLQKGLRGEPIEFFNPVRIQPRIERAAKAFEQGDAQFALEILVELEAEGHIDPAISPLRRQIEHAQRQKTIGVLLESARTRFEHEEHPLALQKIQEVLQLEPGNAPALGLKASIENKLIAHKVDDWVRLTRQHIDNQAFSHAREAVRNVQQLRPSDARAAQMMAEIDQLEQEFLRLRKEKDELFKQAQEAWNGGEVTTALSRMERVLELDAKAPETTAPERAESFQTFYNKVRSEHESLKNSYSEARKHLGDRNYAAALNIANEWLKKFPGHALFQALKFDIEEQQRQEISARIAAIDRQLEAEPDLDRRVNILEQAGTELPSEPHFERQLRPMRDKRDLVNSIAAKARYHEERSQFAEALAQWEILGTIYGQYPGLSFEVERVTKKKEQQARSDAKARWVEQIERAIQAGDYARALALCTTAESEFPEDGELAEQRKLAGEAEARAEEASKALAQGQALWQQQWHEDGLAAMRKALELDPRNAAIRGTVVELVVERARALVDSRWREAEPLIQQALEIDPGHALAKSLKITAQDHKRDEAVRNCFLQARQYRAAGDLASALAEAERCLAEYPLDPRLAQLRDVMAREISETGRTATRPADLAALKELEQQAVFAGQQSELAEIVGRARAVAGRYAGDAEFQKILAGMEQQLALAPPAGLGAAASAGGETAVPKAASEERVWPEATVSAPPAPPETGGFTPTGMFAAPVAPAAGPLPEGRGAVQSVEPPPAAGAGPSGKPGAQAESLPHKPVVSRSMIWKIGGALVVLALLFVVATRMPRLRKASPPAAALKVEVRTWPPGATIRVNGRIAGTSNFQLERDPGSYEIEATLEGYQPASTRVELKKGQAAPIELTLAALPQTLRLITDLTEGKATLDEQPARELQDGQLTIDAVTPGKHTLKLAGRSGQAEVAFELVPGAVPLLSGAPVVKGVSGLIVGSFANRARVYATLSGAKVEVDGQAAGEGVPDGLAVNNLAPGTHELTVNDGKNQLKKVMEISNAPALTMFFQSDQNVGTIVVLTGEDGVEVYLDGQKYRRQTARGGQLRIPREPREYRIRVAKAGFQEAAEQVVEVKKGEEKRVVFNLVALPTSAHLSIRGAPGAEVFVDDARLGAVLPDGTFQAATISPGEHTIELRKEKQRSRPVRRTFTAGQTVTLLDADVALRGGTGTLRVNVTPAGAVVTVARAGRPAQPVPGGSVELDEGEYTVTARAAGYTEQSQVAQVTGGQTRTVSLALAREAARAAAAPAATGMEGWEDPAGWTVSEGWHLRRGGGYVLYHAVGQPGVYEFTLMAASGGVLRGKTLEWVAGYADPKNYVLFRLDKETFRRIDCINGKRTEMVKKPHGLKMKETMATLRIEVARGSIVTRANTEGPWVVLDSWPAASHDFVGGRFGLLIEGRDEVRMARFKFTPKE
jgi:tRNA A-37 threonylcarbamoyl transferase component Bud32